MPDSPRSCVIFNPAAGRGKAANWLTNLPTRLPPATTFLPTTRPGHAVELARDAAQRFDRVIAAGGDGTVHEVANGVLLADRPDVTFAVAPLGSANDYAFTIGVQQWWGEARPWESLVPMLVDVGVMRGAGRERFFVNGCGLGFNGLVTIEARTIRYLRGLPLYSLALLKTLVKRFAAPPMTVTIDDSRRVLRTLVLSLALAQREGGFPLAATARLDDGLFDWLHVGDVARWELIRHLPAMISGDLPLAHPKLTFGRCNRATVASETALCAHTDGEMFCVPGDRVHDLRIELLPRRLRVETYPPALYGGGRFAHIHQKRSRK